MKDLKNEIYQVWAIVALTLGVIVVNMIIIIPVFIIITGNYDLMGDVTTWYVTSAVIAYLATGLYHHCVKHL